MSDDGVPSDVPDVDEDRWRVRQKRYNGGFRLRVVGPGGQGYAPCAVQGLRVSEVRRLHDALQAYSPAPESREQHMRLLNVLGDALTHPLGLEEL